MATTDYSSPSAFTSGPDDHRQAPDAGNDATDAGTGRPDDGNGKESGDNPRNNAGPGGPGGPGTSGDDLLGRVVQGAHATIDRLAETAAPHVQRLQEGIASANESLHARADQARETGDEWAESLRCTVRENPLAAVATALAVGVLIARLTR